MSTAHSTSDAAAGSTPDAKRKTFVIVIASAVGVLLLVLFFFLINGSLAPEPKLAEFDISDSAVEMPKFSSPTTLEQPKGEKFSETKITIGDGSGFGDPPGCNTNLTVCLPAGYAEGDSRPCILMPPAHMNGLEGAKIDARDAAEYEPYLQAGYIVIAFDVDGPEGSGTDELARHTQFRKAQAGMINARNALEFALKQVPGVNPKQIYIVGHGSGGTLALLFAEHDTRLAGCIAFAPWTDRDYLNSDDDLALHPSIKDLKAFNYAASPARYVSELSCPVFMFHAQDDSTVEIDQSQRFTDFARESKKSIVLYSTGKGDHDDAIIKEGIPRSLKWLEKQKTAKPSGSAASQ
ncbi:MAG: prolyl oligopeptidase family serine peptidase [Pirellulales bacterium]